MTHETAQNRGTLSWLRRFAKAARLAIRALQVRLRFVLVLVSVSLIAREWDTLRNYWEHWTRDFIKGEASSRAMPPNTEYFCPMDPGVVSMYPSKCDICNMALVRRKTDEMTPLPSGALARMQLSPYRVQIAGIQTAPAEYRPAALDIRLDGVVLDDQRVECRISDRDRPLVAAGQAAEVSSDAVDGAIASKGRVSKVDLAANDSRCVVVIDLEEPGKNLVTGTKVVATLHRPVADLEPFRSLPANPPPILKGEPLAVYNCLRHPDVLMSERKRCPIDREDEVERIALLPNQRVRWWCPMHPGVTSEKADASCKACGGMTLVPRVVSYRPTGQVLTVPESTVVDTGTHQVVFIEQTPGLFYSVEIATGPRCGLYYPVASGIDAGQRVVSRGAFLLEAETLWNPSVAASYFGATGTAAKESDGPSGEGQDRSEPGVCPVSGKPLGSMGPPVTVTVNGQTVQLCCKGCEDRLRKSPDAYPSKPKNR